MLVHRGTLRVGDAIVAGDAHGKVRALYDYRGEKVKEARPGDPVEILGFNVPPPAGEFARVVEDDSGKRKLELNEGQARHSVYDPDSVLTGDYWDDLLALPLATRGEPPSSMAILGNAGYPAAVLEMGEVQETARKLGLDAALSEIRRAEDIAPAFEAFRGRAQALYVVADPLTGSNRVHINTLALGARLPTMHGIREYAETGGLISYGANISDLFRRAAEFVDKIFTRSEAC